MRSSLLVLLLLGLTVSSTRATSVVPPTFPELVAEADAIYRGRVTQLQVRRVELPDGNGSVIKTFVSFAIERVLKGAAATELVLEFLGGTIGDERLEVSGMPKFAAGDREIVFVQKNGVQFCPLVAMRHGRYRVARDSASGREHVVRDNGLPLATTAEVELPLSDLPAPVRAASAASAGALALGVAAFESNIAAEVNRTVSPVRTP